MSVLRTWLALPAALLPAAAAAFFAATPRRRLYCAPTGIARLSAPQRPNLYSSARTDWNRWAKLLLLRVRAAAGVPLALAGATALTAPATQRRSITHCPTKTATMGCLL